MAVLVSGLVDDHLERELMLQGLELTRDDRAADDLVTLPPPVVLAPLADLTPEGWVETFDAWARTPFFAVQGWLEVAFARGAGSWVAVTSVLGTRPFPGGGAVGAGAMALHTLVRVAALEGGPCGVRANVVAAGWLDTAVPLELDAELAVADTPLRRLATPADVARTIAWLLSPAAAHVTGEVVRVDGGYTITRGSRPDPRKE